MQPKSSQNFDEKINYIDTILKKWKNRNLSLFGKIQILKTYALSQLTLPATTVCIPTYLVKKALSVYNNRNIYFGKDRHR